MTTNWDALLASSPQDKTAAAVTGSGEHFVPRQKTHGDHDLVSGAPLPIRAVPECMEDLTGKQVGRLTVIGLSARKNSRSGSAAWVVRCVCGTYEARKGKTLRDPAYVERAMCNECNYTREMIAGRTTPPAVKLKMGRHK